MLQKQLRRQRESCGSGRQSGGAAAAGHLADVLRSVAAVAGRPPLARPAYVCIPLPGDPPCPRCEAAEAQCAALVATRAAVTKELLAQAHAAAGAAGGEAAAAALAGLRSLEGRLAALDERAAEAAAVARQECRAAVAGVEARLAEQQRAHEAALGRVNAALLAIAKRVGELAARGK